MNFQFLYFSFFSKFYFISFIKKFRKLFYQIIFLFLNIKINNVEKIFHIFRDPRGFAVKFYTDEGIWDLVGNNTPIFFIKDPLFFPSFIHTQKRNPATHLKVRFLNNPFVFLNKKIIAFK